MATPLEGGCHCGATVSRKYCAQCLSAVYLESSGDPGYLFLKAGSLDDPAQAAPEMHIWTEAKPAWVRISDELPHYPKNPPL